MSHSKKSFGLLLAGWLGLAVLMRIVPHLPNLSPFASLIIVIGCHLSRRMSILVTLSALIISDILLALILGYPMFGSWTLFTYSGFALIAAGSVWLRGRQRFMPVLAFGSASVLGYWTWTNIGTWAFSVIYPHTAVGLISCLIAGLPFLQHSAISTLICVPIFLGLIRLVDHYREHTKAVD